MAKSIHESVVNIPEQEAARGDFPAYHFVYCRHTVDNIDRIAAALDDCDMVLVESVGMVTEGIGSTYEMLNAITHGSVDKAQADEVVSRNTAESPDLNDYFELLLAHALYGTNKILFPIDVAASNPVYQQQLRASWDIGAFWDGIRQGDVTVDLAKQRLREAIGAQADANRARERVVERQLVGYAFLFPEDTVRKIGVVQGASHTATSHGLQHQGLTVTRQFVDQPDVLEGGLQIVFPYVDQAQRLKRFLPGRSLPDDLLQKIMVEGIMLNHIETPVLDGRHEAEWEETLNTLRSQIIDGMPTGERVGFLQTWERINHSRAKGRKRRLRALIGSVIDVYNVDDEGECTNEQ